MNAKKIVTIVGLLLVCAVLVWWVGSAVVEAWHGYKWQKQTDAFMEAGRKPYKEDMYGGQTPEETWKMFLAALKKGDVDLASKYFVVEKQEKYLSYLNTRKNNLVEDIVDYEKIRKSKVESGGSDKLYFSYDYYDSKRKQKLTERVVFTLNPYTKIWKISTL